MTYLLSPPFDDFYKVHTGAAEIARHTIEGGTILSAREVTNSKQAYPPREGRRQKTAEAAQQQQRETIQADKRYS